MVGAHVFAFFLQSLSMKTLKTVVWCTGSAILIFDVFFTMLT